MKLCVETVERLFEELKEGDRYKTNDFFALLARMLIENKLKLFKATEEYLSKMEGKEVFIEETYPDKPKKSKRNCKYLYVKRITYKGLRYKNAEVGFGEDVVEYAKYTRDGSEYILIQFLNQFKPIRRVKEFSIDQEEEALEYFKEVNEQVKNYFVFTVYDARYNNRFAKEGLLEYIEKGENYIIENEMYLLKMKSGTEEI